MNEDKLFHKCAWRLMPFMMLLYIVNYLDRVNVGFAALTMNKDLGLTASLYGFGAGLFFAGYILFQVPSSVLLERLTPTRAISLILIVWGAISASSALIQNAPQFYAVRLLLGAAEAGFFPMLMLYMAAWFPASYRTRFTAILMTAIPIAYVFGAPVSTFLLELDGAFGIAGWRWLFVIEGLPACLLGIALPFVLPETPSHARWLTEREKETIIARVKDEDVSEHSEVWPALRDVRLWALAAVNFSILFAVYGVQLWLPQIVRDMGFSTRMTGFVVAAPFVAAIGAMIYSGYSSDIRNERVLHIAAAALLAGVCFLAASVAPGDALALAALGLACMSVLAMQPPFFGLLSVMLKGPAAAAGIALIISVSNTGSLMGPSLAGVLTENTGDFSAAIAIFGMPLLVAVLILLWLKRMMARKLPARTVAVP
jgi:ACS family tartrate transporter-like MFS transporter